MKAIAEMNQIELAAFVQEHLRQHGLETVLSGGTAVILYTQNQYISWDVDLIALSITRRSALREMMRELGFVEKGRHFIHPDSPYFVEFPAGPLAVGREPVKEVLEFRLTTGRLRVISPTDCVKDRLSAFFYWNDRQALEQAILVCLHNPVDLEEVARWSREEGNLNRFLLFESELKARRRTK